jgi:hypothetical protein
VEVGQEADVLVYIWRSTELSTSTAASMYTSSCIKQVNQYWCTTSILFLVHGIVNWDWMSCTMTSISVQVVSIMIRGDMKSNNYDESWRDGAQTGQLIFLSHCNKLIVVGAQKYYLHFGKPFESFVSLVVSRWLESFTYNSEIGHAYYHDRTKFLS